MRIKKNMMICVVFTLLITSLLTITFASDTIPSEQVFEIDPSHSRVISTSTNVLYDAGAKVLNQYTSALVTPSGTIVTTWKYTSDATQFWTLGERETSNSRQVIYTCYNNVRVALNINRSTAQPEVNVFTVAGNYYEDTVIYRDAGGHFYVEPRKSGESRKYLRVTSETTPALDGNGTSFRCRWQTSNGTTLFEDDLRSVGEKL